MKGSFAAVKDHLVVIPLNKPVRFTRRIGGELQEQILLPGSATITPGGADFSIRTSSQGGRYDTLHFYIRDEFIREIHAEIFASSAAIALPPRVGVMDEMFRTIAHEIRKMLQAPAPGRQYLCRNSVARGGRLSGAKSCFRRASGVTTALGRSDAATMQPRDRIYRRMPGRQSYSGRHRQSRRCEPRAAEQRVQAQHEACAIPICPERAGEARECFADVHRSVAGANRASMRVQQPAAYDPHGPPHDRPHARRHPPGPLVPLAAREL